jgi:TATA-box binding protein (TBP) (component of TFIID and TFIIIB)
MENKNSSITYKQQVLPKGLTCPQVLFPQKLALRVLSTDLDQKSNIMNPLSIDHLSNITKGVNNISCAQVNPILGITDPENIKPLSQHATIQKFINMFKSSYKPDDVIISTMTVICKLKTLFNVRNIAKYIELKHNSIVSVKYGRLDNLTTNRSLIPKKRFPLKKKKSTKAFYNQVTLQIKVKKDKYINMKVFKNGSIHMTGCKSPEAVVLALKKLCEELKIERGIIDFSKKTIIQKPFSTLGSTISIGDIYVFDIAMINSNFNIEFCIDRNKLYNIMLQDLIECTYDPLIHASVDVKYNHQDKQISIFIFESGSITITGAKDCKQIKDTYDYINKYLLKNYKNIVKNEKLTNSTILKYLQ